MNDSYKWLVLSHSWCFVAGVLLMFFICKSCHKDDTGSTTIVARPRVVTLPPEHKDSVALSPDVHEKSKKVLGETLYPSDSVQPREQPPRYRSASGDTAIVLTRRIDSTALLTLTDGARLRMRYAFDIPSAPFGYDYYPATRVFNDSIITRTICTHPLLTHGITFGSGVVWNGSWTAGLFIGYSIQINIGEIF
jgi:hypothetical protein